MTHEEYHADTSRISVSGMKLMLQSPAHYWAAYLDPNRPPRRETDAMFDGTLMHTALFEPTELKLRYCILPPDAPKKPSKAQVNAKNPSSDTLRDIAWWSTWQQANAGKLVVSRADYDLARRVADSCRRHPAASFLLEGGGEVEKTIFYTDPATGAPCKFRPDFLPHSISAIVDLKTTVDASPNGFGKAVVNYKYDLQSAVYMDGFDAIFERRDEFIFIAVEKEPPFAVGVYMTPTEVLKRGREQYYKALSRYVECLQTGEWPAYSDNLLSLKMPSFYYKQS